MLLGRWHVVDRVGEPYTWSAFEDSKATAYREVRVGERTYRAHASRRTDGYDAGLWLLAALFMPPLLIIALPMAMISLWADTETHIEIEDITSLVNLDK